MRRRAQNIWRNSAPTSKALFRMRSCSRCVGDHTEMAPLAKHRYRAFTDPAGGSGTDSFTLAICIKDGERIVIDAIREVKPPFSPEAVIDDFAALLKTYRVSRITGDRYAGEFPREQFKKRGVRYEPAEKPKSDLYRDLLPLLNSGRIVLPKSDRLVNQICGLERRTARSGKDSIDHGPQGHDDLSQCDCWGRGRGKERMGSYL